MTNSKKEQRVNTKITDGIAYVSLNRPEKCNALDIEMFVAIKDTIKSLKVDRSIRVVIVTGNGDDFCSGLDIKSVMSSAKIPLSLLFKWFPWHANLAQYVSVGWREVPVPIIMVIKGRCWGGGLQIALGADFRIATPEASFSVMESRWGLIPDMGGTLALKELIDLDIAKELAMTAEVINGVKAHEIGLVTHLDNKPHEQAVNLARLICQQSPDSIAATKKLYNKSWWSKPGLALARESYYQVKILFGSNRVIKTYNQTHSDKQDKEFTKRQRW